MQKKHKNLSVYRIRALTARTAEPIILLVLSVLLAGCSPAEGLYPFAVCLPGVIWDKPSRYLPVAAGSICAALIREPSLFSVTMYCVPVLLYLFCVYLLHIKKLSRQVYRMAAMAVCYLIAILCSEDAAAYDIIMACLSCAGGCALIPILTGAMQALLSARKRSSLTKGELACVGLLICSVLLSLPDIKLLDISFTVLMSLICISAAALALPAGEAIAFACMCASFFLLKGMKSDVCFTLAVMALFACSFRRLGRFSALLGFVLADALMTMCMTGMPGFIIPIQTAGLAAVPAMLLNKKQTQLLRGLGGSVLIPTSSEKELASRSLAEIDSRLRSCSEVFNRLSQIFQESTENKRSKRLELCAHAASRICSQCSKYEYCWKNRYSDTYSDFRELAGMITAAGSLSPYDVSKDFKARCVDWIGVLLDMNTQNAAPAEDAEIKSGNIMMSKQCRSIADMLLSLVKENSPIEYDYNTEERLSSVLCENGLGARDIVCRCREGNLESVTVSLPACKGDKPCAGRIPELLRQTLGADFSCDERICSLASGGCRCVFTPAPRLRACCHAACKVKDGQSVCGDSFSLLPLPGGKYLAAISDGMGSGSEAACESENAVALLETLCLGRMDVRQAYDTVNELLQLRKKSAESYSTMDACVLDLTQGICSWGKIGAVPGYLVRAGRVQAVSGNSLPLGIVSDPGPSITDRLIKDGDLLLLLSDGVYDALVNPCQDEIELILPRIYDKDVNIVAGELVKSALKKNGGHARDDMTVIAIRIEKTA